MSTLLASDLDRTLIYSAAACDLPGDARASDLRCVELWDRAPLSFMTATAHDLVAGLARSGALVPVTTRTVEQYQRIELPGPTPKFAVVANGGRILVDGREDGDYRADLQADLATGAAPLAQVWEILQASATSRAEAGRPVKTIKQADETFCYAVEHAAADPDWVAELADAVADLGWGVTRQLRKVYLVPSLMTKVRALGEVVQRAGATRVLAAGDAHLDAPMLEFAHEAIRPAHGELHEEGYSHPTVHVTQASGAMAGEEIAAWFCAQLG